MQRIFPSTRELVVLAFVACARPAEAQARDPYEAAMSAGRAAEARGDFAAAARALAGVVDAYTQDYAIALELGRAFQRAGDLASATRAYGVAVARAPSAAEARLAYAGALSLEGRCEEARREIAPLGADPGAREIASACARAAAPRAELTAAMNAMVFPGNEIKSSALGVFSSAWGALASGWSLGGAYRYLSFTPATSLVAPFDQNEGYVRAGFDRPGGGVTLEGAVVEDGSGVLGTSPHGGVAGRWSPAGDVLAEATVSAYPDRTIGRAALAWNLPVVGPLRVIPGVAGQASQGTTFGAVSATAVLAWSFASFWAGGKWGQEDRPAYLSASVVYDIPELVVGGAWAGLRARVVGPLWALASYSFDHLQTQGSAPPGASDIHAVSAGAALALF